MWKSKRIKAEEIIEAHRKRTAERVSEEKIILAIQDTSDFNFTHHQSKTEEQGFGMTCAEKYVRGLKVHSIMASTTQGVPLGILEQQIWTRPVKTQKKKKNQKERKSIFNKESKRWLTGLVSAELAIPSTTTVVTVADREGDIYDLFQLNSLITKDFMDLLETISVSAKDFSSELDFKRNLEAVNLEAVNAEGVTNR